MAAFAAATEPYQPPADRLPQTVGGVQPCSNGAGDDSDDSARAQGKQPDGEQHVEMDSQDAGQQQQRENEERREAAYSAMPAQLNTGAVGEVARTYSRLNSAQGILLNRMLKRVRLRTYS